MQPPFQGVSIFLASAGRGAGKGGSDAGLAGTAAKPSGSKGTTGAASHFVSSGVLGSDFCLRKKLLQSALVAASLCGLS